MTRLAELSRRAYVLAKQPDRDSVSFDTELGELLHILNLEREEVDRKWRELREKPKQNPSQRQVAPAATSLEDLA